MTATIVRKNPGGTDAYGDPAAGTETRTVIDAIIAPVHSTERTGDGRSAVIVGFRLFAPYGTDLRATDLVELDGVVYQVDGQVGSWANPFTGGRHGIEASLRRVEG